VMDGDAPRGGVALTTTDAIRDPVAPFFLLAFLLIWTPWPVLGAAAGSWLRRWETPLGAGDARPVAHPPVPGDAVQRR